MTITAGTGTAPALELHGAKQRKQRSLWGDAWIQFRRNKLAIFGLVLLLTIVFGRARGPLALPRRPQGHRYPCLQPSRLQPTIQWAQTISGVTCWRACCTVGASRSQSALRP